MASLTSSPAIGKSHGILNKPILGAQIPIKRLSNSFIKSTKNRRRSFATIVNVASSSSSSAVVTGEKNKHHVAWTSIQQKSFNGELQVQGQIPSWLNGTYLRNGPGIWKVGDHEFAHLFDGYATLVRFDFKDGKLVFGHRQLESEAYKAAMENNKPMYREFSEFQGPTKNPLTYAGEFADLATGKSLTDNANNGVFRLGDGRVFCLTETQKGTILIDPDSLDTLGRFEYADSLGGLIHSSHPIVNESELITLLPDLIRPGYLVVRMLSGSNERKVIGRVDCKSGLTPGWVHSFPVTENYIIVPEMPLRYSIGNILKAEPNDLFKFDWHPESKGFMHVMCRKSGKVVTSVEVPNFITFHYINGYEERDGDGRITAVIADYCDHAAGTSILQRLNLDSLRAEVTEKNEIPDAMIGRFRIPLDGSPIGDLGAAIDPDEHGRGVDMCTINPKFVGKPYRYAYGIGAIRPCNFPNTVVKFDLGDKKAKSWHEPGVVPSEPLFIARPGATEEDDGVVVTMISQENGGGYMLMFDGSTFEEIARAKLPYGLPYGLHGCWVPRA